VALRASFSFIDNAFAPIFSLLLFLCFFIL